MQRFSYLQAQTPAGAALALAANPQARLKAGGVDLLDLLKERLVTPDVVVDISQIVELQGVSIDAATGALRIGALTTFTQLAGQPEVQKQWPALGFVAMTTATPQVRNMATIGGNLCQRPRCWYFRQEDYPCRKKGGEFCFALIGENRYHSIFANGACASTHPSAAAVPLLAYGATLQIIDQNGKERTLPLADFFITPDRDVTRENILARDEILTTITVPRPAEGTGSAYLPLKHKQSFDWPMIEAAVLLSRSGETISEARVVLGSVAPVPLRSTAAEQVLMGKPLSTELAAQAGKAATEGATPLLHNGYKVPLLAEVVRRAVLKAAGQLPAAEEVMTV
jgi:xanthine dehydrogenase YagS FAD-binding subunit